MRRILASCLSSLSFAALCCASSFAQAPINVAKPTTTLGDGLWRTSSGKVTVLLDWDRLHDLGFELQTLEKTGISDALPQADATFSASNGSDRGIVFASRNGRFTALAGGEFQTDGEMLLVRADGETFRLGDFDFHVSLDANGAGNGSVTDRRVTSREVFRFANGFVQFDAASGRFEWGGAELSLDANFAHEVSLQQGGGEIIGTLLFEASAVPATDAIPTGPGATPPGEDDGSDSLGLAGPDVIVGDLQNVQRYGTVGGITAFSVGTTSCNIGTIWLNWMSNTNQHPVIGQNMYRLKNGRFEQVGMSWLKHGFFALSGGLCFGDCQSTDGTHLGVHCSDPYDSGLNGDQSNLGPRWQVNASTGGYPYPPANPATPATIGRRLQVHNTDLDPGQNAGALYFVEGQYVTPDDAAANNKNNNASYRRITVSGTPGSGTYNIALTATTQRQKPGIQAWKDNDAAVTIVDTDISSDGRITLGYKVTDNGNGTWHYEWAVYNMNSDRSGQSFSVPIATGVTLSNVGFHDVDHHSNDGVNNVTYDGTDWAFTNSGGVASWATSTFAQNPNANALHWGSLYNFRFDANTAPTAGNATIGLFTTGSPGSITVATQVPMSGVPCVDQTPPVITCPGNQTAEAASANGASVSFTVTATDDCTFSPAINCAPASGSVFAMGTTTVNCTATDNASRTASCSFTVTVRDTSPPALTCGNLTRECTSQSGANVSYNITVTDAVDPNPTLTCVPTSGSLFPFGPTTVNCTASDHATPPNTRNCSFTVTVRDTTAPTVTCPADITTTCAASNGVVTFSTTATDACDTTPTVTCVPASGSTFSLGQTTVTCTARDDSNNSSTCSFHVTVNGGSACAAGTMNTGVGNVTSNLSINGSFGTGCNRTVTVGVGQPITVALSAAVAGDIDGSYIVWVWVGQQTGSNPLVIGTHSLGCTVGPTPFSGGSPGAFRCIRGGLPSSYCAGLHELGGAPASAPWSITRSQGMAQPRSFTFQGILDDQGSATGDPHSITNAVILTIQ
ncbi:MAG: HYR domain-containing protein [Planctomycetes bacterium]|nr:HYR domain-containing protein [Planctomycetota bacterium]